MRVGRVGKIGIVTINDYNYGNRLQNYGLQQALETLGIEAESIYFNDVSKAYYLSKTRSPIRRFVKRFVPVQMIRRKRSNDHKPAKEMFEKFTEQYIKSRTVTIKRPKDLQNAIDESEYQQFIAGSDQIWNPRFAGEEYYFLTFARPDKRMAYAASIGFEDIPEAMKDKWSKYWGAFNQITVREEAAANIVKQVAGRDADVVLDPTLLVEKQVWNELIDKAVMPDEIHDTINDNYVFAFFIGEEPDELCDIKRANNVIDISDENSDIRQKIGPIEFVRLISNADMVLTDSYHCLIFSIIYSRKYKVYQRNTSGLLSMNTRMDELFKLTGLSDEKQDEDYSDVKEKIQKKREQSLDVLRKLVKE